MVKLIKKTKEVLKSDLGKAGVCGALLVASPVLPAVAAGQAALAGAIGLGYFSGKHVQKKNTLRQTLQNNSATKTSRRKKSPSRS